MRYVLVALFSFAMAVPSAFADDQFDMTGLIRPGLWETITRQESDGKASAPDTDKTCITTDDVKTFMSFADAAKDPSFTLNEFNRDGNHVTFKTTTAENQMTQTMQGDMVFTSPVEYRSEVKYETKNPTMSFKGVIHIKAHRIGDCQKDAA